MKHARILIAAPASGTGKTLITCGILSCLKERNMEVTAFKCGPDYIDPMFHKEVLQINSYNLDTFMCGRNGVREILARHLEAPFSDGQRDSIAVIEGVMGYYDGLGGVSTEASAYDVADATDTPVVLLVDCKGLSVSVVPVIKGFLSYKEKEGDKRYIKGVILNRLSPGMYGRMKELIERETSVKVYGYVPVLKEGVLESRYLGLQMPQENVRIRERLGNFGRKLSETVDIEGLIELSANAPHLPPVAGAKDKEGLYRGVRIGIAADEAFCFCYQDNLEYLEYLGARVISFSPLHDTGLPEDIHGLLFYGGYPELYAKQLAANHSMRICVKEAVDGGTPCIAECGGFLYLQEQLEGKDRQMYPMAGVFQGESRKKERLQRFGYLTLTGGKVFGQDVGELRAHEFHYYDSEKCGSAFTAKKPLSDRTWECMISTDTILAGYPHFHYLGNKKMAEAFLEAAKKSRSEDLKREKKNDVR